MKIALPVADGQLCLHFGHCQAFAVVEVDENNNIVGTEMLTPPPHQPGVLPPWVADQGVSLVIAGGMGGRAINLFNEVGVEVIVGAPPAPPEKLVSDYLAGNLQTGSNACDH